MTRFNFPEDMPLTHPLVTRVIVQAQVKVEGFNFEGRKSLLDYDDVLNKQREIIYGLRKKTIEDEKNSSAFVLEKTQEALESMVTANTAYATLEALKSMESADKWVTRIDRPVSKPKKAATTKTNAKTASKDKK
jgi:preprotein translocase subunit SecA